MDAKTRKAIESDGFQVGDAADFLGLTEEERQLVDLRLRVARAIRVRRQALELSQGAAAARIKTTQPRFAKIEAAAGDVSLDQLFRSFFAVGGRFEDLTPSEAARPAAATPRKTTGASKSKRTLQPSRKNANTATRKPVG